MGGQAEAGASGLGLQDFCFLSDGEQKGRRRKGLLQAGRSRSRQELAGMKIPPFLPMFHPLGDDAQRLWLFGTTRDTLLSQPVLCCGEQQLLNKRNVYF